MPQTPVTRKGCNVICIYAPLVTYKVTFEWVGVTLQAIVEKKGILYEKQEALSSLYSCTSSKYLCHQWNKKNADRCVPTTSLYYCKLFPIFTSLHALLTITVVLRTAQIAKSRSSFQSCFKVLKDHYEMTVLLIKISFHDLWVDSNSRPMCFFVKQIAYNIFMSFNVDNWPLAPQSKEISSDSPRRFDRSTDQHSTRAVKKWWWGDHAHLKGLETWDVWLISSNTHCFYFYAKFTDIPCMYTF